MYRIGAIRLLIKEFIGRVNDKFEVTKVVHLGLMVVNAFIAHKVTNVPEFLVNVIAR